MYSKENFQQALLQTLCYADIFDYPLTSSEIFKWLIGFPIENKNIFKTNLEKINNKKTRIKHTHKYYHLRGSLGNISMRKKRQRYSQEKIKIAKRVGERLKLIRNVKAVAITGALAMENSKKNDDIDLMIITSENRLWLTRLFVVLLVSLIAKRRTPAKQNNSSLEKQLNNTICLNLFLDETALSVSKAKRNLYTAHEVAQTKFLWSKDKTKEKIPISKLLDSRLSAKC